jgi:hypothetical protein
MASHEALRMQEFRIVVEDTGFLGKNKKYKFVRGKPGDVLPTVNQWLVDSGCRVVSIESLYDWANSRSTDSVDDFNGIRLWYMTTDADQKLNAVNPILVQRKSS